MNFQRPTSNGKSSTAGCAQRGHFCRALILCLTVMTCFAVRAEDKNPFYSVTGPCNLRFPEDHGPHPGYRTEWWYYTGNLKTKADRPVGFQFTIFRSQITPPGGEQAWPNPASAWRTRQIYLGHAAVSVISEKRHLFGERILRNALGMAGTRREDFRTLIYLHNWLLRMSPEHHHLSASTDDFSYQLDLTPAKPPVLHGLSGYSRKGSSPDRASCYYSFTRLHTRGTLTIGGRRLPVQGQAWMDHEFSTAPLEPGIVGWDWFSLQLSDETEAMIYLLRNKDGTSAPASSGTYVDETGGSRHLAIYDLQVAVLDTWKSPNTGAVYPAGWRLGIVPLALDLTILPRLKDQEIRASAPGGISYWEGSVSVKGTKARLPVTGLGYVELTGYEKPMDVPM